MALEQIQGGFFDKESHAYYDESGRFVPSVTQVLRLVGLTNYDHVRPEVLANKARIGTEVHELACLKDRYREVDPTWISDAAKPHFAAYEQFVREKCFEPDPAWTERSIIATIYGMRIGVTPDRYGLLGGVKTVIELKCVEAPMDSWGFQTAIQSMAIFKSHHCGPAQRMALQLTKSGKYKLDPHTDNTGDCSAAIAALTVVYARMRAGEKVWERV